MSAAHGYGSRTASAVSSSDRERQCTKDEFDSNNKKNVYYSKDERGVGCRSFLCGTQRRRLTCYFSSCAIFLLLVGIITPLILDQVITLGIRDSVVIDSTSATNYDVWQSNFFGSGDKSEVHYDVYLFDLQNHDAALSGSKPVVVERGPYAFKKYWNKFDISWSDGGDTVTYTNQVFFQFNPERSGPGLSLSDQILLPYPVVLGFNYLLEGIPMEAEAFLDATINAKINDKLYEVEAGIDAQIAAIEADTEMTQEEKDAAIAELNEAKGLVEAIRVGINDYVNENPTGTTLLKLILCLGNPQGISPFFKANPVDAYFGYFNDPILLITEQLLVKIGQPVDTWSTAVPGIAANYTSESDTARRINPIVQKTGDKDLNEVGQLVTYGGMPSQWVCVNSGASQNPDEYVKGEEFPACELFQYDWNATTAEAKGYVQVFATDYANRIDGGDGQLFAAPTTDEKIQMYIPDIYRTLYLAHTGDNEEWYDVKLRRYQLQLKDLQNSTENLEEGWQYFNNAPTGMENLTLAAGLPSFASKPHFLDGAASLQTAVEGLNARREIHDTFLDVEPNTGMLANVHKRLQLNYQMNNVNLPEITDEAVAAATMLCESKNVSCDGLDVALQCLAVPSNWEFYNGRVYMPYAWADEHLEGTEDSADGIKDGVYWAQDLGVAVRFWCFVSVGFIVALVFGLYWGEYNVYKKILNGDRAANDEVDDVASHYNLLG